MAILQKIFLNNNCTGCGACKNICPVGAIEMKYNDNGFYFPFIDETKCVNCGKCDAVCPQIKFEIKNDIKPLSYAISANDEERKNSASGGFFPVLAKYVLNELNGYVCGVAWNKNWEAEHIIIDKEQDLQKLRFSKYVQANTGDCFKQIKELLENDKYVLFSGTPCQVAGLLNFLGKTYDKLVTIDLICHGVPSPKIWQEYLEQNFNKNDIVNVNFRKKEGGWIRCCDSWYSSSSSSSIDLSDGNKIPIGLFYEAFIKHILSNDECLECKYRTIPRPADFTCGDFWSYKKYDETLNDKKGLSILLLNNEKAKNYFNIISKEFKICQEIELKQNSDIELSNSSRKKRERNIFFKKYLENKIPLNKLLAASINKHYDIGFCSMFNGLNYGSALVSYAANQIFENLGYSVLNIHQKRSIYYDFDEYNKSFNFAQKNYFISKEFIYKEKPIELNKLCDNFVLGSDTLWWWEDVCRAENFYWLDFVTSDKRKISFCTSFAFDTPSIPQEKMQELKYLYKRLNSISVREESGIDILKDYFDCNGTFLWDPTLIANKEIFDALAMKSKRNDKNYIFAYILDLDEDKKSKLENFAKKLDIKLVLLPQMHKQYALDKANGTNVNVEIEDFVYLIKNAEYIVTDSFHGSCFSVIFEKKFVSVKNNRRGGARYKIFDEMNLQDRFINSFDELYNFDTNKDIDYTWASNQIKKHSEEGILWLKNALEQNISKPDKVDLLYDNILYTNSKLLIDNAKHTQDIQKLKESNEINKIIYQGVNAKKHYLKYRFLSNFVFGKIKERYIKKKKLYQNRLAKFLALDNKNWRN